MNLIINIPKSTKKPLAKEVKAAKQSVMSGEKRAAEIGKNILVLAETEKKLIKATNKANSDAKSSAKNALLLKKNEQDLEKSIATKKNELERVVGQVDTASKTKGKLEENNEDSKEQANQKKTQIIKKAETEAALILTKAKETIEELRKTAITQLETTTGKFEEAEQKEQIAIRNRENEEEKLIEIRATVKNTLTIQDEQREMEDNIKRLGVEESELKISVEDLNKKEDESETRLAKTDEKVTESGKNLKTIQDRMLGLINREKRMEEYIPIINKYSAKVGLPKI